MYACTNPCSVLGNRNRNDNQLEHNTCMQDRPCLFFDLLIGQKLIKLKVFVMTKSDSNRDIFFINPAVLLCEHGHF